MLKLTPLRWPRLKIETLAIPVCEDADIHDNPEIQELIAKATALMEFSGEKGQQVVLYDLMKSKVKRCIFIGLGPRSSLEAEQLRSFAGRVVKMTMEGKQDRLTIAVPLANALPMEPQIAVIAIFSGSCLANHVFGKYKGKSTLRPLKEISILLPPLKIKDYAPHAVDIENICLATHQAREWVSMPSNEKTPGQLAQMMQAAAEEAGLKVNVLSDPQLRRQKFGALLAVAAGSVHQPRLVEIVHSPRKASKTILFVGKGVTFDSGGINIKPSQNLDAMKSDMAGAATVAAAMIGIAKFKPAFKVVGITPLVENMPSGSATRPGDIITAYSGKTVEIGNTDAEGRLILADALAYAIKKHKPDMVIDLATLTGACVIALGEKIAGFFSNDEALAQAIIEAGETTHERCWRMPLPEDYKEMLKSDLADISNMANSRYGGAITAALFLSEFVGDTPWAHIDIAGPAFAKKGSDYCGPGGTGFGVRLLCRIVNRMSYTCKG